MSIIDLSWPFVDANMACVLFNIGITLYLESDLTSGKVIAINEFHKVCVAHNATYSKKIVTQ